MSFQPGDRCGPYEIVDRLGKGGMGEVFRAHDVRLGRDVAIKVLPIEVARDRERLERFDKEARAAGALNHPNVLSVFDIGETPEGTPYLVSELLEGETLRQRLNNGPLPWSKVPEYGLQLAKGLAAAHERGIIHRDLKPENIFLTRDGRVKILDFGLAKLIEPQVDADASTRPQMNSTEPGVVLGTVGYMSPEQVRGQKLDHRSDLFALGCVLLEMYSGERAFLAGSTIETLSAILNRDPAGFSDALPAGAVRIIRRCLEKVPGDRFQSAQDLAFALESLSAGTTEQITERRLPWRKGFSSKAVRLTALALAAVVLAVAAIVLAARARRTPAQAVRGTANPTFRQLTFRLGTVTAARFAPDGQTVVYSAAWEDKPLDVFTTRRSASESRSLALPGTGVLSVSAKEELALSRDCVVGWGQCMSGTLARVSLAGGAPREMLADVAAAEWSPDGAAIAVVRPVEGRFRLEFPPGRVLFSTEGWIKTPRFSSDGKRIAFCHHPVLGDVRGEVTIVDLEGRVTVVPGQWGALLRLAWAREDSEIWLTGSRSGARSSLFSTTLDGVTHEILPAPSDLDLMDVARNGDVLLLRADPRARMLVHDTTARRERELSWLDWSTAADISRDGQTILFYEWGRGANGSPAVYLRHSDASDPVRLGDGRALALSPDGQWALALNSASSELSMLPTGVGERRVLPRGDLSTYYSAAWFPDSKRILFVAERSDRKPATFIQQIDGGAPAEMNQEGWRGAIVSPDGTQIAGYGRDGEIYRLPLEGGVPAKVAGAEPSDSLLEWSEDGKSLFVRGASARSVSIFRIDLNSGHRNRWSEIDSPDPAGFVGFDADGVKITPDGRSCLFSYWKILGELFLVEGLGR